MPNARAATALIERDALEPVHPVPHATVPGEDFVSVIIPHYNDIEALNVCIAALRRQTWPADRMEIIIADNNSACGLANIEKIADGCRVIHAAIQGAGPARNEGAAAARGNILAFIDSDCHPRQDWIERGVKGLAGFDFVGGYVETAARDPSRPTPVEAWEIVFGFNFERHISVEGYTGSGNMWVWRHVFDSVGGFRASVSEDMDWSFRATAAGYRLGYAPAAAVSHLARASWPDLLTRWRRVVAEHYVLNREKSTWLVRWLAWTAAMPASIVPHAVRVLRSDRLPNWQSKSAALVILIAHRLWRTGFMLRLLFTAARPDGHSTLPPYDKGGSKSRSFAGLTFADMTLAEAVSELTEAAKRPGWRFVVTPNAANFAQLAGPDKFLLNLYRQAEFCFLDSRVIFVLAKLFGRRPPQVVTGADLVAALFNSRMARACSICIVGGGDDAPARLRARFDLPNLYHINPAMGFASNNDQVTEVAAFVTNCQADFTFLVVGFPAQELVASEITRSGLARGVGICAGASIDFLTGTQRRAPRLLQKFALEWLFRLIQQPKRMLYRYMVVSPRGILFMLRNA